MNRHHGPVICINFFGLLLDPDSPLRPDGPNYRASRNASTPAEAGREWREVGALVRYVPLVFRSYSSATTSPRAPLCGPSRGFRSERQHPGGGRAGMARGWRASPLCSARISLILLGNDVSARAALWSVECFPI